MANVRVYLAFRMRRDGNSTAKPIKVPGDDSPLSDYPHIPIAGDLLALAGKLDKTGPANGTTRQDLFDVAKGLVDGLTDKTWKIDDVGNAIPAPSKWNPQSMTWDPVQTNAFAWKLSRPGSTGQLHLSNMIDTEDVDAMAFFTPFISVQVE